MKLRTVLGLLSFAALADAQHLVTLDQALDAAQSSRPAVQSAQARLAQAKSARRALGAYPATRLETGYSTSPESGGSDDDLVLVQPLDVFGRRSASQRMGDALVSQAEANLRSVLLTVQSEVVSAYIDAAGATHLAVGAGSTLAVYERLYEAIRLRVEGGVAPGFHLTQVSLDLEQARLVAGQREAEAEAARQRLAARIGQSEALAPDGFPAFGAASENEAALKTQRPDLMVLAADLRVAEADLALARVAGRPELELQGRRTPWQESEGRTGLRLQLSIPLFDSGRTRAETDAARLRVESASRALADAEILAQGETRAAATELANARSQVVRYEDLVGQAKGLVERLRPGLTEQATTLIEVLDATRVLRDLERASIEAKSRLAQAHARYIQAKGLLLEARP